MSQRIRGLQTHSTLIRATFECGARLRRGPVQCARAYDNISSLKKSIKKAASSIDPMEAQRACDAFRRRPKILKEAHGGHIE